MKLTAYSVIVLQHSQDEDTKIIQLADDSFTKNNVTVILAKDQKQAELKVAQQLGKSVDLNEVEIIVRSF
jgi:hypothetical protein